MTKHTRGGWTVDGADIIGADGRLIAQLVDDEGGAHHDETQANAALIAAAPELLAALSRLVFEGNTIRNVAGEDFNRAMTQAEAAIKKAEAKQ